MGTLILFHIIRICCRSSISIILFIHSGTEVFAPYISICVLANDCAPTFIFWFLMAHMLIISTSSLVVSLCVFVGSELELFNCLAIGQRWYHLRLHWSFRRLKLKCLRHYIVGKLNFKQFVSTYGVLIFIYLYITTKMEILFSRIKWKI